VHINGRVYNVPRDGTMVGVMNVTDDYVDLIYAGGEIVRCLHAGTSRTKPKKTMAGTWSINSVRT
jgi:hypothetical protein